MRAEKLVLHELIALKCIKNFSNKFKNTWVDFYRPYMKKGWTTWTDIDNLEVAQEDGTLILEDNAWPINFPRDHFEIIE